MPSVSHLLCRFSSGSYPKIIYLQSAAISLKCKLSDNHKEVVETFEGKENCDALNELCLRYYKKVALSRAHYINRQMIFQNIKKYLKKTFHPSLTLKLFGSSVNGFGSKDSDVDVCLSNLPNTKQNKQRKHFEQIVRCLKKCKQFNDVEYIHSRVPIIKCIHKKSSLHFEFSLNNEWPIYNSNLLHRYSKIDERCLVLVHLIKYLVKQCNVVGPFHGYMSSYAYTIMVLFYLQQIDTPVLPVLQELKANDTKAQVQMVDGYSTYYFKQSNQELKSIWPKFNQNRMSCGELWMGMLHFYTNTDDFINGNRVITIRQHGFLSSKKKMHQQYPSLSRLWHKGRFRIEDPFELHRNLGSSLNPKTLLLIVKVFKESLKRCQSLTHEICEEEDWSPTLLLPTNRISSL
ncbi:terminal uridylyltransferase 7-like [Ciona intestinalis]